MMSNDAKVKKNEVRRRKLFILPELQLKVVLLVLLIVLPMLMLNFMLVFNDFWASGGASDGATYAQARAISWSIFKSFMISIIIAVPFCIAAGIVLSFRFGGPLYRFHCFLRGLAQQRWDAVCKLRKGDNLTFLRDDINAAVAVFADRIRAQQALLQTTCALLDRPECGDDARLKDLLAAIRADCAVTAEKLGEGRLPAGTTQHAPAQERVHA